MIESPLFQELIAELDAGSGDRATRETTIRNLMTVLVGRFGSKAEGVGDRDQSHQ